MLDMFKFWPERVDSDLRRSPLMLIHPIHTHENTCPCGALISENEHNLICRKCAARARWERRSTGRRRRARHDSNA